MLQRSPAGLETSQASVTALSYNVPYSAVVAASLRVRHTNFQTFSLLGLCGGTCIAAVSGLITFSFRAHTLSWNSQPVQVPEELVSVWKVQLKLSHIQA